MALFARCIFIFRFAAITAGTFNEYQVCFYYAEDRKEFLKKEKKL